MWIVELEPNSFDILKSMPDASVDSVVTDPPYELGFMGKTWDSSGIAYSVALWSEVFRVLKPGGHLLAFGGTRTYHRMTCAIEDAGFEIRDSLHWIYGSGFPKSRDISKAIDKEAGAEREIIGDKLDKPGYHLSGHDSGTGAFGHGLSSSTQETRAKSAEITAPATEAAKEWDGWGTALKPAHEPIVMARKPLEAKTVAANVLEYGCGGINVDGCRVATDEPIASHHMTNNKKVAMNEGWNDAYQPGDNGQHRQIDGRWPPNVILSDEAAEEMDRQSGTSHSVTRKPSGKDDRGKPNDSNMVMRRNDTEPRGHDDAGGASRFFPCFADQHSHDVAWMTAAEREEYEQSVVNPCFKYNAKAPKKERPVVEGIKPHATVKPVAVMRWLVKLVTPPGGTVLDPFCGSGTTAEACELEGLDCIAIDKDPDSIAMTHKRMSKYLEEEVA